MILGCMNFGKVDWGITKSTAENILDTAFDSGIRKFDTASFYAGGLSEKILGNWVKRTACRDNIEILSKAGGGDPDNPEIKGLSARSLISSTESSLTRLSIDHLDTLTLHWPDPSVSVNETLDGVSDLLERKLIKSWALSNYYTAEAVRFFERAIFRGMPLPKYSHVHLNLLEQHAMKELIPENQLYGISTLAWSPLCGGVLCDSFSIDSPRFNNNGSFWKRYNNGVSLENRNKIASIAADYNISIEYLALGWLNQADVEPIFGAENPQEIIHLTSLNFKDFPQELVDLVTDNRINQYPHDVLEFSGVQTRTQRGKE